MAQRPPPPHAPDFKIIKSLTGVTWISENQLNVTHQILKLSRMSLLPGINVKEISSLTFYIVNLYNEKTILTSVTG